MASVLLTLLGITVVIISVGGIIRIRSLFQSHHANMEAIRDSSSNTLILLLVLSHLFEGSSFDVVVIRNESEYFYNFNICNYFIINYNKCFLTVPTISCPITHQSNSKKLLFQRLSFSICSSKVFSKVI